MHTHRKNDDKGDSHPNEWIQPLKGFPEVFNYRHKLTTKWKANCFKVPKIAKGTTYMPCKENKVITKILIVLDIPRPSNLKRINNLRMGGF